MITISCNNSIWTPCAFTFYFRSMLPKIHEQIVTSFTLFTFLRFYWELVWSMVCLQMAFGYSQCLYFSLIFELTWLLSRFLYAKLVRCQQALKYYLRQEQPNIIMKRHDKNYLKRRNSVPLNFTFKNEIARKKFSFVFEWHE